VRISVYNLRIGGLLRLGPGSEHQSSQQGDGHEAELTPAAHAEDNITSQSLIDRQRILNQIRV
jgi:hypothetical protein